ncbi:MAG: glycosyltransferase [Thermoleophilia bacterium]|nr:glycosyltransferase [Thermoleophilia bacterium]
MNLVWRGPVTDPSGYAAGGRALLRGLVEEGARVRLEPNLWNSRDGVDAEGRRALIALTGTELPDVDASVQHTIGRLFDPYVAGRVRVGRTTSEVDRIPADWVARCDALDEVWVPTAIAREALVAAGVASDRVAVVPEPLELDRLDRTAAPLDIPGAHGTVFLAAFDWSLAKGWDALLGAWCDAFAAGDDVTLVLKAWGTGRGIGTAEIQEELLAGLARQGRDPARMADLVIVEDLLAPHDVCRLYAAADAVVAPTRVEGWNRVPLEAMAMGRPVVATAWPGTPGVGAAGWPVGADLVPVPGDAVAENPSLAGRRWAEPRPADLVAALRDVHHRPDEARARGAAALARIGAHDHRAVARIALDRLGALARRPRTVVAAEHDLPRVVIEGCLSGVSSLAGVNRELARALLRRGGIDLALVDTDGVGLDASAPGMDVVAAAARRLLPGGPEVVVRQVQPPTFNRPARGRLVQVLHWEFGPLPPDWVRMIDESADEVWVASTYVRDWMIDSGVDRGRLAVLPLGVDPARFRPDAPPADLADAAPGLRFLFVGGLHARKGVDLLLDAYERAFRRSDDVTLVIKDFGPLGPYPPGRLDERVRAMAASTTGPRVLHLSAPIAEEAMPGLYTACHCLVHPCRGEAYGLTIAEAMACGLPVVVPDRGAARDFTDPSTAFLVPAREVELPFGEASSYRMDRNPVVHEVDPADLAAAMRAVHDDQVAANVIGARASDAIRTGHTWDRTAAVAAERIGLLTGRVAAALSAA